MVSIIIPTYNRESVLGFTIDSVLSQTYPDWECLLIDDGSTDRTLDIAESYCKADPRIKLYRRDRKPKNANTCRNIGIGKSKGEYIIFLDSDDKLKETCLENRVKIAVNNPLYDFWVFKGWSEREGVIIDDNKNIVKGEDMLAQFLQMKLPWITASPLWKSSFIKELDGFDENLSRFQDVELHIRSLMNLKLGFYFNKDSQPDWIYKYRLYNPDQKPVALLKKRIDSCLYIYKKLKQSSLDDKYFLCLRSGVKRNFLDFLFDNVLVNFQGQKLMEDFAAGIDELKILPEKEQRKVERLNNLPKFIYSIPGIYRAFKLYLI